MPIYSMPTTPLFTDSADKGPEKVDVTFVIQNGRNHLTGEEGFYTNSLSENGISYKSYEGVDVPNGFQTDNIHDLAQLTGLLVMDCFVESGDRFRENDGATTGLRLAEWIRTVHKKLPIWLLDPPRHPKFSVGQRTLDQNINIVRFLDVVPSAFTKSEKELLGKNPK